MIELLSNNKSDDIALLSSDFRKTYKELNREINSIGLNLVSRGIVLIICDNTYENILIYLACLRIGAIPLLLGNNIDDAQFNVYIDRYRPIHIFSPRTLKIAEKPVTILENYFFYSKDNPLVDENIDLAMLLTTSGSTGNPKLVKVTKKNLLANTESICGYLQLSKEERHIVTLPMNYTYGLSCINTFLFSGGSIIINTSPITGREFWTNVDRLKPTYFSGVPYTYELIEKYFLDKFGKSTIANFTQAGGKLKKSCIESILRFSKEYQKRFIVMYGQTEATARMSYLPFSKLESKLGSIGKAIPGGSFSLRNKFIDQSCKGRFIGELVYQGDNVTQGYANSFHEVNKIEEHDDILNTGDLAWIDQDDYVYIVGRLNRFAKISGIRVSLNDIDNIMEDLGYNCATYSDDAHLYIVIETESNIDAELTAIKNALSKKINIPPLCIRLKTIKELPRLESGKINYKLLG